MESIILISILFVKSLSKNLGELGLGTALSHEKKENVPSMISLTGRNIFSFEYIDICLINLCRCTDLPDRYAYCTK